ncbi:MAG TPA: TIGR03016 family PEP-CTERM system-associated outer membrane protein [Nitrospirae bacterium]|nr:TIGR03016 family PEP-CTERM system-associated outer membrane protein [Nitrospirota bacterium]
MKKTRIVVMLFLAPFFFVSMISLSEAELRLTPAISLREEYNDNIFLTAYDEEDDFLTTISPAIALTYAARGVDLSLDYRLDFDFYTYNSDRNEIRQRGRLESTISPYRDIFFIRVSDVFARVPIDVRRQVALDNILTNTTDSNRFIVNPYLEYPLSETFLARLGYTYENLWYEEGEGDDAENNSATLSIIKEISSKMKASLAYTYLSHRPDRTEDYDRQDAGLSIDYKLGPKLSLNAGAGQTWFVYKIGTKLDSTIWNIKADYLLTQRLSISAGSSVSFSDSVNVGAYERKSSTGSISYSGKSTVTLTAFRNIDKYIIADREDRSKGLTLGSSIPVTSRITGILTGRYIYYKFFPEEENVDRYGFGLSFKYSLRMLTATLGYTHNLSNSDIEIDNYRNNIAWLQVRLTI